MKYIITVWNFLLISLAIDAQINYDKIKNRKLVSTSIDTLSEKILVLDKKNALLYFRQSDIKEYIKPYNKLGVRIDNKHSNLESLLNKDSSKIILTDWWDDYSDDERKKLAENKGYKNSDKKYLNEFYYIGADLIYDGKFKVVDKKTKELVTKKLKIKRVKGLYGTRYVEFQLPDKRTFWTIATRLGE